MVIDTMVFAYALLKVEDYYEQALEVLEETDLIIVPDSLFAELLTGGSKGTECIFTSLALISNRTTVHYYTVQIDPKLSVHS